MATGGFKSNATTDFLEEWKAKREKMRAKMLGDIAAATGAPLGASNPNSNNTNRHAAPAATELTNNGSPDRSPSAGNYLPPSYTVARSSSGTALKRPEEEAHHLAYPASPTAATPPGSNLKKAPPQTEKAPCASPDSSPMACNDSDKGSPSPSAAKEKKSSGPSARKGKGQIEKRKLREKRRSTGVVSIPSNEVSQACLCLMWEVNPHLLSTDTDQLHLSSIGDYLCLCCTGFWGMMLGCGRLSKLLQRPGDKYFLSLLQEKSEHLRSYIKSSWAWLILSFTGPISILIICHLFLTQRHFW